MKYLKKYNWELQEYEIYAIPESWNCPLIPLDLTEIINCCQCGKEFQAGQCYTSLEVHNHVGLGYGVCEECYGNEWERKRKNEKSE